MQKRRQFRAKDASALCNVHCGLLPGEMMKRSAFCRRNLGNSSITFNKGSAAIAALAPIIYAQRA
jgi:hypothetical protein